MPQNKSHPISDRYTSEEKNEIYFNFSERTTIRRR